jgi:hypothetical protein
MLAHNIKFQHLHTMLFYHTRHVLERQIKRNNDESDGSDGSGDSDEVDQIDQGDGQEDDDDI